MLQGKWTLVSGEQDGVSIADADLDRYSLTIDGDRHRVCWSNAVLEGTHELDATKSPMTIDSIDTAGPFEGMRLRGVFELDGDELTVCFANAGQERPTEFSTQNENAIILHRWKREK